jgi:hypothetical protein
MAHELANLFVLGTSSHEVGSVREVVWKSGEKKKQRLLELSDQFRRITWETIEAGSWWCSSTSLY